VALREVYTSEGGGPDLKLIECPVCGADLSGSGDTYVHFLYDHGPEDFGLSPLGDRPDPDPHAGGELATERCDSRTSEKEAPGPPGPAVSQP
jgi:hypothetical protein